MVKIEYKMDINIPGRSYVSKGVICCVSAYSFGWFVCFV